MKESKDTLISHLYRRHHFSNSVTKIYCFLNDSEEVAVDLYVNYFRELERANKGVLANIYSLNAY